jgi:hypothetical protein
MLASQALWFGGTRHFLGRHIIDNNQRWLTATIAMAQRVLESQPPAARERFGDLTLVPDSRGIQFEPRDGHDRKFEQRLVSETGSPIVVRRERGKPDLWIQFSAGNGTFWLVEPTGSAVLPYWMLAWIGIVLHRLRRLHI